MKISKYTKLGVLIVFCITVLIWGLSYLKGRDFFNNDKYYHVVYDRVEGLAVSDAVTLNGFKVGQVKLIKFAQNETGNLIVTISVNSKIRIPVNSVARIISSDIMGTKSIKIVYNPNTKDYQNNDTIPGAVESDIKEQVSMQVLPLKTKAEQLLATIDSAITILTVIFNEDARENLSASFKNINQTLANIEETSLQLKNLISKESGNVSTIIENFKTVSNGLEEKSKDFEKVISNLSAISDSLAALPFSPISKSITDAAKQISEILIKLNSNEGTAGKLINDEQIYTNLENITTDLDRLLKDIRLNPKRYLNFSAFDFGKEVVIASSGQSKTNDIIFKVNLISTSQQIPLNSSIFDNLGEVEEYSASGAYSYLIGSCNNYDEILQLFDKATIKFPDAKIVAFRNGRLISLERALKLR